MDLFPTDVYLLKWSSIARMGGYHLFVVKCEFIKYFDDTYCTDDIEYNGNGPPPRELIGSIFKKTGQPIIYDFDNPLYPYSNFKNAIHANNCNIGLFKIISIEKVIDYGIERPLNTSSFVNTNLIRHAFINNGGMGRGTLLWVDLDEVSDIMPANSILEEKAVKSTPLPDDIKERELYEYLNIPSRGGKRKSRRLGGNRNRNRNRNKKSRVGKSNRNSKSRRSRSV